ncbi:uncharacterized protein [Watersipora subatra]|uniref:uncharacterized protein isoform X5 n=1 Tax=Watersipora subatra TaxID=2589382 RepID=UPI00355B42DA
MATKERRMICCKRVKLQRFRLDAKFSTQNHANCGYLRTRIYQSIMFLTKNCEPILELAVESLVWQVLALLPLVWFPEKSRAILQVAEASKVGVLFSITEMLTADGSDLIILS